ncbi:MAG: hypothetical protein M9938_11345 [Solirubrobacterales bacterium]|nr:hypothetical protein [Solirubrobacterales bacterium]
MSPRSLQILAIVLGALGVLLGALGAITAYNAKQSVRSDSELTADIKQAFAAEQARQDSIEKKQASDAEKFVADLSSGEKRLVKRIVANTSAIKVQRRRLVRLRRQVRGLRAQTSTLASRDRGLSNELASTEADLGNRIDQVNARVNKVNRRINRQQNQIARLRGFVSP